MKESDPNRVDPDSWAEGYNSIVGSYELPFNSLAKAGAHRREWEASPYNPKNLTSNNSAASSSIYSTGGGGWFFFIGFLVGAGIIASAVYEIAWRNAFLVWNLAEIIAAYFIICCVYVFLIFKFRIVKWITLFLFSLFAFGNLIFANRANQLYLVGGLVFIFCMLVDRAFILSLGADRARIKKFLLLSALCVGAPAMLLNPYSTSLFKALDVAVGVTHNGKLEKAGLAVTRRPLPGEVRYAFDIAQLYNQNTDSYDRRSPIKLGSIVLVRIVKIVDGKIFTCIDNQAAMIDSPSLLVPYDREAQSTPIAQNYANDKCEIVIPRKYGGRY